MKRDFEIYIDRLSGINKRFAAYVERTAPTISRFRTGMFEAMTLTASLQGMANCLSVSHDIDRFDRAIKGERP